MKKSIQLLLIGSLISFNLSCYYDQDIEFPEEEVEIPDDQEISFRTDIEPLFSQSGKDCTLCHNGSIANPDLRIGNAFNQLVPDYVIPGDAEGSELFQKLPGNNHPIDAGFVLTNDEIALIRGWIDRGAENN
ncbi:hypothetical protein FK220_009920 [Flavobacteriaceae bacterium TP-CH-4]|uniref:Cytochrome c domain-containing protein n=1 Tax=Pelagihabitans pacificus TaxID=2696054 RepID=A0A967EDT1_9FLAO|nr:hypothetical protein [Pelagihabitans pacificus]NHF59658.1 hypothetical protein [Pelagihabitans pacificus]